MKVVHIFDGEYGCEENAEPKCVVTLEDESGTRKEVIKTDSWLTEHGITEGSEWPADEV